MDRMTDSGSVGWAFESPRDHKMKKEITRRKFISGTLGAGAAMAAAGYGFSNFGEYVISPVNKNQYDPKGLPTVQLGKTGVIIPRMAIGLGSRFLTIASVDEALEMCNFALENGLYYWDTAHDYVNTATGAVSEERLGHIVKNRRKEIFLSTKISAREPDKFKAEVEESLKRLQTDHLDIMKIHSVTTPEDVAVICKKGGVLDVLSGFKDQKVTRFIGFSGHASAEALKAMADTGRFDTMLFAMNHYGNGKDDRQGIVIPAVKQKGMGVMLMKTVRPKETIAGMDPAGLVRFGLSLDGPDGIIVGMDSKKVVQSNLDILRNFKPMPKEEKLKYASALSPFFNHHNLDWMNPEYRDGVS
jgi:predicted aldo/keto reductase-like oxidoreductase